MKKTRLALLLLVLILTLTTGLLPRTGEAAPLSCSESCARDYQRCSERGYDSTVCFSRYDACIAGC